MIKDYVVYDEFFEYSGPFELKEFYMLMDSFFKEHHYDKNEKRQYEKKNKDEWYMELELEPFKTVSDYVKLNMNMEITIRNIENIEIELQGKKRTLQQADLKVRFRSFILKDYEGKWEAFPWMMFLRTMVDKFVYKMHVADFSGELANDTRILKNKLKSFLNLYKRR